MPILVKSYKASELAWIEKKNAKTIRNNNKKYIAIRVDTYDSKKRSKRGYSIRYIRKSDLNS